MQDWLSVTRGEAPIIISIPHAGTHIPPAYESAFVSAEEARYDADFHVEKLYAFAAERGATLISTAISRSIIDVNRNPSGASLYPGQTTTELCPTTRFNGTPLYRDGWAPDAAEVAARRAAYFDPYHATLIAEIARLKHTHRRIVLYDAHSILSRVPRLFDGELPVFNIGTFDGKSCDPALSTVVAEVCASDTHVLNGRFKGGWITRHYGEPRRGVHAIQMELAMRAYLDEAGSWPPIWDAARASVLQEKLEALVSACLNFAAGSP